MQSTSQTQYTISVSAGDDGGTLNFYSPSITDAFILSLAETLRGVTWPAGTSVQITTYKSTTQNQSYSADLTQASPSFT